MKRLFLIAAVVAAICSCTANKTYTVKGQFKDCMSDSVWLVGNKSGDVLASAPVSDGSFVLSGEIEVPVMARITTSRFGIGQTCDVVLEPGEMEMSLEFDSLYLMGGTKANEGISNLKKTVFGINEKIKANEGAIDNTIMALIEDYENSLKSSLKDNLDNFFGLILVESLADPEDPESTRIFLDKFPDNLKKTQEWKELSENVEKLMNFGVGKPYLDFTQNDSSKGFEIIGVSLDRDRDSWLNAIRDNEMDWIHVSDLNYWSNEVAQLYNIHSIPANYLIDCQTGLIVEKGLRGNNLANKLADLLK